MNDLELKVLALGEAHRRIRDQGEEQSTQTPEVVASLLVEMHHSACAMRDMVRRDMGLCTDLERKLNHWIFPLALWEREREAREDAQREAKLQAMYLGKKDGAIGGAWNSPEFFREYYGPAESCTQAADVERPIGYEAAGLNPDYDPNNRKLMLDAWRALKMSGGEDFQNSVIDRLENQILGG